MVASSSGDEGRPMDAVDEDVGTPECLMSRAWGCLLLPQKLDGLLSVSTGRVVQQTCPSVHVLVGSGYLGWFLFFFFALIFLPFSFKKVIVAFLF